MLRPVAIVGTGNVAHHLVKAIQSSSIVLAGVYGRNIEKAKEMAGNETAVFKHTDDIPKDCICIIAIKDDALPEVLNQLKRHDLAHTSGSAPLASSKNGSGVFYPLQTFSKTAEVDMSKVPFLIEANFPEFEAELKYLASELSKKVLVMDSENRSKVHLAAVLACNFSNHLYTLAQDYLAKHSLDDSILQPLIETTALKLRDMKAAEAQTGPAIRRDKEVVKKQVEDLQSTPDLQELYILFTQSILNHHGS